MKKIILTLGLAAASFAFVQAQDQTSATSTQEKQSFEGEGIEQIDATDIPEKVNEGMKNSDYKDATIKQAYKLTGGVVDQVIGQESVGMYASNTPKELYLLQVSHEDKSSALYFTETGKLYASRDMKM